LILVSNNPQLLRYRDRGLSVRYVDGSAAAVLLAVRDLCHRGHRLLTHPLAGSVKPNETPYKSILLSDAAPGTDADSVQLIEKAIAVSDQFGPIRRNWRERELLDFQTVDASLLAAALESAGWNGNNTF